MQLWERDGAGIDVMRKAGEQWQTIGDVFDCSADAARKRYGMWEALRDTAFPPVPGPPIIEGHTASNEVEVDIEAVWAETLRLQKRAVEKGENRQGSLEWTHGPIAIVTMADLHLGGLGVDYSRLDDDISMILGTPGMYVVLVGDMLDNFIIGKLKDLRMNIAPFTVSGEWALVKRVLKRLAPRLIGSCSGNHDLWTYALSGIDYLADLHARYNPTILYHKYDLRFDVSVGESVTSWRVRHSWKGSSIYNDLHGVHRASKFDKGIDWDVGVGAHTHASGLFQEFNNGGKTGYAILCGTYKMSDDFAERNGFPQSNESAAVTTVIHEDGFVHGTNNLEGACKLMHQFYDRPS